MRPATGLSTDLQRRYKAATRKVMPADLHRRYMGNTPVMWADHYAKREPHLEEAMWACWDYPDREIVCAAMYLLVGLAAPDLEDRDGQRKALATGFRNIAKMLEKDSK